METEDNNDLKFTPFVLFLIASLLFIFFTRNHEPVTVSFGIFWVLVIAGLWSANEYAEWRSRYYMSWVCADGIAGSFSHNDSPLVVHDLYHSKIEKDSNGNPLIKKFDWLVYGLGANIFPYPKKGKLATLVVPAVHTDTSALNHKSFTKVSPVPLESLAKFPMVYNELLKHSKDFNLDNIYIGLRTTSFKPQDTEDIDIEMLMERQSRLIHLQSTIINDKADVFEKMKNLGDLVNPKPTFMDNVSNFFKRKPEQPQGA